MIIYANSSTRTVSLEVPVTAVPGTMDVTIKKDGVEVYEVQTVAYADGKYSFTLPFFLSQEDADLVVDWKFDYIENTQTYTYAQSTEVNVVTPYIPLNVVEALLSDEVDVDYLEIEKAVRNIINAHCGQSFGKTTGKKIATAEGGYALSLPARLLDLNSITRQDTTYPLYDRSLYPVGNPEYYLGRDRFIVVGDGWYVKYLGLVDTGIKADHSDYVSVNGPIFNPYSRRGVFADDISFVVDGSWGWSSVPAPVQEAARLLINDYATPDSAYRDRYLTSLTSPDWRIQFNSGAFRHTGNVRADQLLAQYVLKRGWAVI